ncbi:hypothetical protein, partial [Roseivivax lentus]|uniref:hypothetical protein n=1 Tax=Roseivivax lentus TaxID=633194 RepID=UPI001F3692DB
RKSPAEVGQAHAPQILHEGQIARRAEFFNGINLERKFESRNKWLRRADAGRLFLLSSHPSLDYSQAWQNCVRQKTEFSFA